MGLDKAEMRPLKVGREQVVDRKHGASAHMNGMGDTLRQSKNIGMFGAVSEHEGRRAGIKGGT